MQEKKFFDVFGRYKTSEEKRNLLERAHNAKFRYSKAPMRVEVELDFDAHEDAEALYEIEDECCELYQAASFKILPHYKPEIFREEYFSEIVTEASLCGAVTHGFFSGAEYVFSDDKITIKIPFFGNGVDFVKNADTESIISNILMSRYGIKRNIHIVSSEKAAHHDSELAARREAILLDVERQNREDAIKKREESVREREEAERAADPYYGFTRLAGISNETGNNKYISDTKCKMGPTVYDFSEPSHIFGDSFQIVEPSPLSEFSDVKKNSVFLGTVFEVSTKDTRTGDKTAVTIGISDGASGTYLKRMLPKEECSWVKSVSVGMAVAAYGKPMYDKFDNEPFISLRGLQSIKREERMDFAENKRVELHLHTNQSQMDALINPAELIKTAVRWGHKAIAVTDHGNVQAFPEIMLALEKSKSDLKVLYGIEAYYVNDTERCVFGTRYPSFDDEMVVFDLETTGLSKNDCKIIEIGAVKIKGGEIIDKMDIFVDPECKIPPEITELTSITDEMVKGAPKEKEALEEFFSFVGDDLLIAHNAGFDMGFVRVAAERYGFDFSNTYLDTVGLSRYVNPELKKHKLDIIAEHYGLADFHHHRASDDAETLARIFFIMIERLKSEGVGSFQEMVNAMSEKTDPLKLRPYHMIIFAKNLAGLKNLYKLISFSYLNYYKRFPRMPRSVIEQHREGLIIGSACEAGELFRAVLDRRPDSEIEEIASFYDYL